MNKMNKFIDLNNLKRNIKIGTDSMLKFLIVMLLMFLVLMIAVIIVFGVGYGIGTLIVLLVGHPIIFGGVKLQIIFGIIFVLVIFLRK